ncbi:MAG: putative PIG3 family NAD(P)H quinone oxidoreductase [Kiritimatiellia bacterium]
MSYALHIRGAELVWAPWTVDSPAAGEVQLRVSATAVNRADLVQRAGRYPPPPGASPILGLECVGVIERVGEDVVGYSVGQRVAALLTGGGYAQRVNVPYGQLFAVPDDMSDEVAVALPEALCTAYINLWLEADLRPGERVLLHAGASGVGTTAIQLCRELGNPVWVTVGSQDKVDSCVRLGAEAGAVRHDGPWLEHVKGWTDKQGFDVILDPVGGAYLSANQRALAARGRLVLIGLMGGRLAEVDLGRLLVRRQRIVGSVLRSRSIGEKSQMLSRVREVAWPLCTSGRLRPQIHAVLPVRQASEAHALLAGNQTFGKVVLTVELG